MRAPTQEVAMLRARIDSEDGLIVVIGLSNGNLRNLKEKKPILLPLQAEYGLPASLLLLWGETEEAIRKELSEHGLPVHDLLKVAHGSKEAVPSNPKLGIGPTGEGQGSLSPSDEGGLRAGIATKNGKIFMTFGKAVAWLAMNPIEARSIGAALLAHAETAEKATAS